MAHIFHQFGIAINAYSRGLPYLFKRGYRRYLALPILINLLFFISVVWLSIAYSRPLLEVLFELFGYNFAEISETWSTVLIVVLHLVKFLIFLAVYKYLVLIVLAPILAFLSEKIEKEKTGEDFPFQVHQFIKDLGRALVINVWNFFRETVITLLLLVLGFFPLFSWLCPFAILLVQSYFYGYGLMDYNAERWQMGFKATERWMWKHKGAVAAIGLVFHLVFLIPLLGWIFAPVWGVIAGSLSGLKLRQRPERT